MVIIMKIKYAFLFILFVLFFPTSAYCQNPIGYLHNNDNYGIRIMRNNVPVLIESDIVHLFQNDIIYSRDAKKIIINWAPYARGKFLNDTVIVAAVVSRTDSKKMLNKIGDAIAGYLGFIKEDFYSTSAAQRSIYLTKFIDSTLTVVSFLPVVFTCSNGKTFTVYDFDHKELFTEDLKGENSFEFIPQKIDLKSDSIYYWKIMDNFDGRVGKIKIIDNKFQKKIRSDFSAIDKLAKNLSERNIKKALYLQMLSEIFYNDLDLYWLSYQMVQNINISKYPDAKYVVTRYIQHVDKIKNE